MKPDRKKPAVQVVQDTKSLVLRTYNQVMVLRKAEVKGRKLVQVSFFSPRAFDKELQVDAWTRGESRFNIAIKHFAISESNLFLIYQLMDTYTETFEKAAQKLKLWVP